MCQTARPIMYTVASVSTDPAVECELSAVNKIKNDRFFFCDSDSGLSHTAFYRQLSAVNARMSYARRNCALLSGDSLLLPCAVALIDNENGLYMNTSIYVHVRSATRRCISAQY